MGKVFDEVNADQRLAAKEKLKLFLDQAENDGDTKHGIT
jgi:hypothetical protein